MESPSPLSGWVILEQAILTLQPGSSICPMGPVVLTEKPEREACWWGETCLHVCLLAVLLLLPQIPSQTLLSPCPPLGRVGESGLSLSPKDFFLSLVANLWLTQA